MTFDEHLTEMTRTPCSRCNQASWSAANMTFRPDLAVAVTTCGGCGTKRTLRRLGDTYTIEVTLPTAELNEQMYRWGEDNEHERWSRIIGDVLPDDLDIDCENPQAVADYIVANLRHDAHRRARSLT